MPYPKLRELARQFSQNGVKRMLEDPLNVSDLLAILGTDVRPLIDFARMKLVPTTRQKTLIRLLGKRFGRLPAELVRAIEAAEDIAQLDEWLDGVVTAKALPDVGIGSAT